jgi:ankyrin repeat protein
VPLVLLAVCASGCTSGLVFAAQQGDLSRVEWLLRWGANPEASTDGYTALMYAAARGDTAMVGRLLRAGAFAGRANPEDQQMTALMYAARKCRANVIPLLVSSGATVDARRTAYYQDDGGRVRVTGLGDPPLSLALRAGCGDVAAVLLEHGADPNTPVVREDVSLMYDEPSWTLMLGLLAQLHQSSPATAPVPLCAPLELVSGRSDLVEMLTAHGARSSGGDGVPVQDGHVVPPN